MLCKNYHIKISVSVLSSHLRFFLINRSVITCFGSVKRKFQGICSREISISSHEFDLRLFSFVIEIPQLVLLRTKYPIKITVRQNHELLEKSIHSYKSLFVKNQSYAYFSHKWEVIINFRYIYSLLFSFLFSISAWLKIIDYNLTGIFYMRNGNSVKC